jgi:GAF domain-containing protein
VDLPEDVRRAIHRLNGLYRTQQSLFTKLEAVVEMVQAVLPGCDSASISLTVESAMFTGASSSQLAIEADLVQYRTDEGPCLEAAAEQSLIRIDALAQDERFEHFAPGAIEAGVESVLSIPLTIGDQTVGSLNLYSRTTSAFDEDDPSRIADYVAYAARLVAASPLYAASADTLALLVEADQHAAQIGIAIGILIVIHGVGPDAAWDHLLDLGAPEGSIIDTAQRLIAEHEQRIDDPDQAAPDEDD